MGLATLWQLRLRLGPTADLRSQTWDVVPTTVEPLFRNPRSSCSVSERVLLQTRRRLSGGEGNGVAAICKYVTHLAGWPEGEDECLLEFPVAEVHGIGHTTAGSRLALAYYNHTQGGIVWLSGPEHGRSFVSLDARWCKSDSVVLGLRVLP